MTGRARATRAQRAQERASQASGYLHTQRSARPLSGALRRCHGHAYFFDRSGGAVDRFPAPLRAYEPLGMSDERHPEWIRGDFHEPQGIILAR